jgi:serine/threonine-protein kinase
MTPESSPPVDREQRLDEIIADYLDALEADRAPDRHRWLAAHPDFAAELKDFLANQDQFDSMVAPWRATPASFITTPRNIATDPDLLPPLPQPGDQFGPYELLAEIGRGGMGVVYRARHPGLDRLVALKCILAGQFASPREVQRFHLEAEAVAQLDHPNIVPVYEVGEHQGWHYYGMKLIEGESLAQALKHRSFSPTEAARLLAAVARAIGHAHERGILHRDLKPGNILLQKHEIRNPKSETSSLTSSEFVYITDFGLAKRVVLPDEDATTPALQTNSGAALGTPAYMAPEQAVNASTVTTAADVYSLGAILYELLAGRPPFKGPTPLETLMALLEKDPVGPRTLRREVPRDLETICLKCLTREPEKRYPSAQALAADLERFLAGEAIEARPAGALERFARWCSKRPLVAALSAALLVVASAGVALVFWQWQRAEEHLADAQAQHREVERHLAEVQRQKELADANFRDAQTQRHEVERHLAEVQRQKELVDSTFREAYRAVNDLGELTDDLARLPGSQKLRKKWLERSLAYYQRFLEQRGADSSLAVELADAHHRIAWITSLIGPKADALEAHQKARAIYQKLYDREPENRLYKSRLATAWHNVGQLEHAIGHTRESQDAYETARRLYDELHTADPKDAMNKAYFANTWNSLGVLAREDRRAQNALAAFEKVRTLREELVKEHPKEPVYQTNLAAILNNLAVWHETEGDKKKGLQLHQEACDIQEKLVREYGDNQNFKADLAFTLQHVGMAQAGLGQTKDAFDSYKRSLALREELARDNPSVIGHQMGLAGSHTSFGVLFGNQRDHAQALKAFQRTRKILEDVHKIDNRAVHIRKDLAQCYFNLGVEHNALKQYDDAVKNYRQSVATYRNLVEEFRGNLGYRDSLSGVLNNLGLSLSRCGQHDEAPKAAREAVELERGLCEADPKSAGFRRNLSQRLSALAQVEGAAGDAEKAIAAVEERKRLWPGNGHELARAAGELSAIAAKFENDSPARTKCIDLALATLREALEAGYRDFEQLRKFNDLRLVRERPEFEKLLAEFEKSPSP